jgi:hypothetical protein
MTAVYVRTALVKRMITLVIEEHQLSMWIGFA